MMHLLRTPPGKLWRGKSKLGRRAVAFDRKILEWALSIRPGDYIATCEGCNRKVASVEYLWANEGAFYRGKTNRTWFLWEVKFEDTKGLWHYCPGGGCASPKSTPEKITEFYRSFYQNERKTHPDKTSDFQEAVLSGVRVVDEFGELLPEFDK